MRSLIIVAAAGLAMGSLPIAAFDSTLPRSSIIFQGDALRTAIADGMSRAGAARADADASADRH